MDANEKRLIDKIVANSFYEDYALYACTARKSEIRKIETSVDEIHQKIERKTKLSQY